LIVHLLWIVPLVLLIVFIASPRFRGDIAETRVRRILATGLEKNRYTIFNSLVVPAGGGTIKIDHVVVSKFGIFVIESQLARGWVSGGEFQDRWKQYHLSRFTRLDNPMHRNALQAQALQKLLDLPASKFHPIVVLAGQRGFKTQMPDNLLAPQKLVRFMRKKGQQLLSDEQAASALKTIMNSDIQLGGGFAAARWNLVRLILLITLLGGVYFAFRDDLTAWWHSHVEKQRQASSSELYHPDGSQKTEQDLWEDSLVCGYSSDTGRCFCYQPDGSPAEIETAKCRSLAERGSILNQ
jgi:hypothetical protein